MTRTLCLGLGLLFRFPLLIFFRTIIITLEHFLLSYHINPTIMSRAHETLVRNKYNTYFIQLTLRLPATSGKNSRQFFHADDCDIVGLLCLHKAHRGGESDIVSSHEVFNFLQRTYPDVAETLTQPIWYFDRKGEVSQGEEEWIRTSVFYKEVGENGRVYVK